MNKLKTTTEVTILKAWPDGSKKYSVNDHEFGTIEFTTNPYNLVLWMSEWVSREFADKGFFIRVALDTGFGDTAYYYPPRNQ